MYLAVTSSICCKAHLLRFEPFVQRSRDLIRAAVDTAAP